MTLAGHTKPVLALRLIKSGELASGSVDCSIKIWNFEDINYYY